MKAGEKRVGNTMDSNPRHVTPRVRRALSIVVASVRSVLNITSGFLFYTPGQVNKITIWHPLLNLPGYGE